MLPQGGHYAAGAGTIASQCGALTITQPGSTRGVIDWTSFSIGRTNTVTFNNGSGATLNRVTASAPSVLLGSLNATGSVYLINPQGIVVGRSGVISAGGRFVASTLDLPDTAFMNGGPLTFSGTSNGKVVNLGKISSSGGDIFLIARDVVLNDGVVSAPNGTAEYVVGQQVMLSDSSSGRQLFVQTGSKGTVVDRGTTLAAQINLEAADGNIYALAGGGSRIRATGTATRDGHIWLVADSGHVTQQGTIAAKNLDGGGTVDTLAATLTFAHDATVQAGLWDVSTPGFTVDRTTARAFMRSLNAGTSVDASATGTAGASGDLTVASNLGWTGPASLSLAAAHDVTIAPGKTLRNTGSGNLSLRADSTAIDNAGSVANHGTIDWSNSTGTVSALYDMNGSYSPGTIVANSAWTAAPYSGLVTQVTGYKLVNSLTDLQNISLDLAGNYALGKDIDATPASGGSAVIGGVLTPFTGQFDGVGHTISNVSLHAFFSPGPPPNGYDAHGLFSVVGTSGVVRNLAVQGNLDDYGSYGGFGLLVGVNYGTIANAHTSGSVFVSAFGSENAGSGGLVGWNSGTIMRSSSAAAVTSEGGAGGLVGTNGGTIRQSFASGAVNAIAHTAGGGGLAAYNGGLIVQSYATGAVTFSPNYCGGYGTACLSGGAGALVLHNGGTIEESFATGRVISNFGPAGGPPAVGIADTNDGTVAGNVYWDKDATGTTVGVNSGALVPAANGLTTEQMETQSSFVGYDFSPKGVWALPAGATHPVLRWQSMP
ncbi:filamentous hemagglutinin family protein [Paraburkholderia sp. WSM4177]|nr:filamentous hemagglutinin family protein [Paraburkholderia sp. WSM4177]MBB5484043.1 filamentous hemagglutinin family protein [Paraburkholderia sp. WSM4180]